MKIIGSVKEDLATEKRISITPETVKKFAELNFSVLLEKKYGEHLGINDEEYKNKGVTLYGSVKEVLEKSQIILKVNCPSNDEINSIKDKSILIGQFNPLADKESLNKLIKKVQPFSDAKYIQFETVYRPEEMPGQRRNVLSWPYVEGLRMDEAMHPLTILSTGLYGHDLLNQNGAPLRLVVPWKYGFKSIKSIVAIRFVNKEPEATWSLENPREYGFYSNVNPNVDHPRWTQSTERRIGEFFRRPTLMFNGYAEEVSDLYKDMDLIKYY